MNLSEKTEMLERFYANGIKMLELSQRPEIPCIKANHELTQALRNMGIIEAKIRAFDKLYYGNRQAQRCGLTNAEYTEPLDHNDFATRYPDHEK